MAQRGHAPDCPGCEWDDLLPEDVAWFALNGVSKPNHRRLDPPVCPRIRWWNDAGRIRVEHNERLWAWCEEQVSVWQERRLTNWAWPCPSCGMVECDGRHVMGLRVELAARNAKRGPLRHL